MSFGHAWVLLLIPLYAMIELFLYYRIRTRAIQLPTAGFFQVYPSWRSNVLRFLRFAPPAAIVFLLFGISSPESVSSSEHVLPSGIHIMVVLDTSGSMAGEDIQPGNRLEGAKQVLRDFIRGRRSDRIGLIVFGGRSVTRSPLTLQHDTLLQTLESTRLGGLPEGTAIGMAIMSGINRLLTGESGQGDRILILITDGRNNGEIHPLDAANFAIQHKIRIYTIGVGGFGPAPYPVFDDGGKKTYRYEKADLDEQLLKTIALRTGGEYFRASDPASLTALFRRIDQLERSEAKIIETRSIENQAHAAAVPALFLTMCYVILTMMIVRLP